MLPVAHIDLKQLLQQADSLGAGPARTTLLERMKSWPVCLIRAVDYMHEIRVRHKDIKPENILIRVDTVFITDFGISRDCAEFETITSGTVGVYTPMYRAPEVADGVRRGRAADVFSLGCVFLEIATVILGPAGSRERFRQHRENLSGSSTYATCMTGIS